MNRKMTASERIRDLFAPKRGLWEGALFGLFLAVMHLWELPGPVLSVFRHWSPGWCNAFFVVYIFVYGLMGTLLRWPGDSRGGWLVELFTLAFFILLYAGIWQLMKGRSFWLGFALLLLTLLSLLIPMRLPFI